MRAMLVLMAFSSFSSMLFFHPSASLAAFGVGAGSCLAQSLCDGPKDNCIACPNRLVDASDDEVFLSYASANTVLVCAREDKQCQCQAKKKEGWVWSGTRCLFILEF